MKRVVRASYAGDDIATSWPVVLESGEKTKARRYLPFLPLPLPFFFAAFFAAFSTSAALRLSESALTRADMLGQKGRHYCPVVDTKKLFGC